MSLKKFLHPQAIFPCVKAKTPKQILNLLIERAAEILKLDAAQLLQAVVQDDTCNSINLGGGVALPHGRVKALKNPFIAVARLETPIVFSPSDNERVDLFFLLLSPEQEFTQHLLALASIGRFARTDQLLLPLRVMSTAEEMYKFLCTGKIEKPDTCKDV